MSPATTNRVSARGLALAIACLGLVLASGWAPAAFAAPAFYAGNSADGTIAVFTTEEQMVTGDTDQEEDIFVRALDTGLGEYLTRQVSIGPSGGNNAQPAHFDGMSRDGNEIFFSTSERLAPGDTDSLSDLYVRNLVENRTLLVSVKDSTCTSVACPGAGAAASFLAKGVASEGGVVFFGTNERLAPADQDGTFDFYARDLEAETTELVSTPDLSCSGCAAEGRALQFSGTDASGDRAFFTTEETLSSDDDDSGEEDIYVRDRQAGSTELVSRRGTCPPDLPPDQNCEPSFGGVSPDGSHVFFETNERVLEAEDTDEFQDVYEWTAGAVTLISTGPAGGNGEGNVTFAGSSSGGEVAFFETSEPLVSGDTDSVQDIYRRQGSTTTLVSEGEGGRGNLPFSASFEWVGQGSPEVVVFTTSEALVAADGDSSPDVYARSGGVLTLLSIGPEGGNEDSPATFAKASDDGSKVFFSTSESLVGGDTDLSPDVYLRSGGGTVLVSVGQVGGNGEYFAGLPGISATGSRAFFTTQERLAVDDDFAVEQDIYGWTSTGTLLVSVKNSPDLVIGPPPPTLEATNPASPNPSTTPTIIGQAASGSLVKVYKTSNCSGEPVAQGTAAQLASPGLTVTVPVVPGTTTNYRATAEAEGVVSACSSQIFYKQEDPPPPPPPPDEEGTGGTGGGGTTTDPTGASGGGKTGKTGNGGNADFAYVTPQVKITFGPIFKTRLRRPVFRFSDTTGQPGTRFFCRVDRQPWKGCSSPIKLKKLKLGRHSFAVKAVNAVGTPSPRALKRAFKVVAR